MANLRIKYKFIIFIIILICYIQTVTADDAAEYLAVTGPCNLEFPRDHGAHPGHRTEWWYFTGNLHSTDGKLFGFQLTFFRRQISPPGANNEWPDPASAWRTQQIYLAHAAVSDVAQKRHLHADSISRGALKLAGVEQQPPQTIVYLKTWSARLSSESQVLEVDTDEFAYKLFLVPKKPPVLHGLAGYSLKGSTPERASCYYSYTQLDVSGSLTLGAKTFSVSGQGWMDHEFSSASLEPGIIGWDWFSLQLSDRTEIMLFFLRTSDGRISPVSGGTFVDPVGRTTTLGKEDIAVTTLDTWKSPHSKAVYPSRWRLQVLPYALDLLVFPNLADQEMLTSESTGVTYWEGSVSIRGTKEAIAIQGLGYVELTGYAESFDVPM